MFLFGTVKIRNLLKCCRGGHVC